MNPAPPPPAPSPTADPILAAKYPSPKTKVPKWLIWLYPDLQGLEDNPLFIRLSGLGYCKKSKWYWRRNPAELEQNIGLSLVEIGVSPILLIFIPLVIAYFIYYAIVSISLDTGSAGQQPTGLLSLLSIIYDFLLFIPAIGILVFLFRVIGIFAPSGFPYRFISNGQSDVWGEELLLSSLTREDYRDAIFGAGVIHSTRRAAWLTVFLSVGQMVVQVCFGLFMFSRGPGTLTLRNVFAVFPNFLELTLLGGLIFLYLTAMGSFNLILSMRAIASIMNEGAFPGRITEMGYAILRVGIHLPGAILLIASLIFIRSSWRFYTAVVILTTAGVAYALTRDTLSKNRGDYGRAFFTAVRRKYGD